MRMRGIRSMSFGLAVMALAGCTAIDISKIISNLPKSGDDCKTPAVQHPNLGGVYTRLKGNDNAPVEIPFVLPRIAMKNGITNTLAIRTVPLSPDSQFSRFAETSALTAKLYLPPSLREDNVVDAIHRLMIKTSAQAQIAFAKASGVKVAEMQEKEVNSYHVPKTLSHGEMKDFAKRLFDSSLRPEIIPAGKRAEENSSNSFFTYFIAYYEGKFVDRLGQSVQKPKLSLTIPDADIAAAETALVEYIVDLIDPTPILGDTDNITADVTKFYPGGTTSKPTASEAGLATYQKIPSTGCGLTTQNAVILADIANAAGDSAAGINGLVSQSFGGLNIGLGVLGKFSFGDNQTLGTVVKTAASRLAARSALAFSYWAFSTIDEQGNRARLLQFRPSVE